VVLQPETDLGPFFTTVQDFHEGTNLTAAAAAGARGMDAHRASVLQGVPLQFTLNVYAVNGTVGQELPGATAYVWCADAWGRYSATSSRWNHEDTSGEQWLRSKAVTNRNGQITFNGIVPGWYPARTQHYHLRVAVPGSNDTFAVTTQLLFNTSLAYLLKDRPPYSSNDIADLRKLDDDLVYKWASPRLRRELMLNLEGSVDSGFSTTFNLGIDLSKIPGFRQEHIHR